MKERLEDEVDRLENGRTAVARLLEGIVQALQRHAMFETSLTEVDAGSQKLEEGKAGFPTGRLRKDPQYL